MSLFDRIRSISSRSFAEVDAARAAALVDGGAILLDVREPHEWDAGHAPLARHVPLGQLPQRVDEIPTDRPVVVVCRSGNRSARAAALLARNGREAANLVGGMHDWSRAGLPIVATGGRAGRVA
jgi:rhodanese-related sulfurtransferase